MSQQPFQPWLWNYQQQEELVQQQQQQHRHPAASTTYQPMQLEYIDGSNQPSHLLYQDFYLANPQNELQAGPQSRQDQPSLSLSQLPTDVFTFGGLPTYSISQLTNEQQTPVYTDGSNLSMHEQLITGSIQQQNDTLSTLLTHRQQRQQRWLSQYPYSRQLEVQTPNELFTPMQSEHQLDQHGIVQSSHLDYVQSQVYSPTEIIPRPSQSQANIQQVSLQQSNFDRLVTGFPDKSSQMEIDERSSRSQVIGQRGP
ncbi:7739_t:CDS:2, partial [Paraglomus brasilianum]